MAVKGYLTIEDKVGMFGFGHMYTLIKTGKGEELLSGDERTASMFLFATGDRIVVSEEKYSMFLGAKKEQRSDFYKQFSYFELHLGYFAFGLGISILGCVVSLKLSSVLNSISVISILILLVLNIVFFFLLRRRTVEGRKLQDEIEGFKLFLSVTEKDRMNFHNPPGKTPELFEKFLPYALALGVEQNWAEQFSKVFEEMSKTANGYHPAWYVGNDFNTLSAVGFATNFSGSFSHAISASSTAPGSSSGFGGGFSGGGGGGGGGGGW
jgi:uncharacterized membrane protein